MFKELPHIIDPPSFGTGLSSIGFVLWIAGGVLFQRFQTPLVLCIDENLACPSPLTDLLESYPVLDSK
eukprot:10922020-Karenia_brevis.AAC.1